MRATIEINGKYVNVDLSVEQVNQIGLGDKLKLTGYEKSDNPLDVWYYAKPVNDYCRDGIGVMGNEHHLLSQNWYEDANYYTSKQLAIDNSRADRLMRKLRRYAAEHDGIPTHESWEYDEGRHYTIVWDYEEGKIRWEEHDRKVAGAVYFNSFADCNGAIREFYDELVWYFTSYNPMLY